MLDKEKYHEVKLDEEQWESVLISSIWVDLLVWVWRHCR